MNWSLSPTTIPSKNDPELLRAFLRASKKGFEDMKNDPDGSLDLLLSRQNAENFPLTRSVEEQSLSILLPAMEHEDAPFLRSGPCRLAERHRLADRKRYDPQCSRGRRRDG